MNRTTIALVDRFVSFRFVSNRPQTTTNDLVPRVSSVSFRSVPLRPVPFRSVSFRSVSFLRVSRARAHTFFRFVTYSDTSVERRPRFVDQRIDARISTGFFVRSFVRIYIGRSTVTSYERLAKIGSIRTERMIFQIFAFDSTTREDISFHSLIDYDYIYYYFESKSLGRFLATSKIRKG